VTVVQLYMTVGIGIRLKSLVNVRETWGLGSEYHFVCF